MNKGKTVFAQVMDFVPIKKFHRCVERYKGNHRVRSFTCSDQLLCMAFTQLTYRERMRDIECCLRAIQDTHYQIGMRSKVSHSALADANETRGWRVYREFAQILIDETKALYAVDDFGLRLDEAVYV